MKHYTIDGKTYDKLPDPCNGSATQTREFEDCTVDGTYISWNGAIYGATISNLPDGSNYTLVYTTDGGVTSQTAILSSIAPTDVPATYGSSAGVLKVVESLD